MNILISGVTLTGNMGGVAMLKSTLDQLDNIADSFSLLSIDKKSDTNVTPLRKLKIVGVSPIFLLMSSAFLLLLWPVRKLGITKYFVKKFSNYHAEIASSDAQVDLSGIAFVDGRGLPLLAYNMAVCLPALFFSIPVYKLSQALGPFNNRLNKLCAQFILSRCEAVIARGKITFNYLQHLKGITKLCCPDTAFLLPTTEEDYKNASEILKSIYLHDENKDNLIIFSPSEVMNRLAKKTDKDFIEIISKAITTLSEKGWSILLLPHSFGNRGSKNNDKDLVLDIKQKLGNTKNIYTLIDCEDPSVLRCVISHAHIFVGCRFHAIVSAMAVKVPTLVIGWSHKYEELITPLWHQPVILDSSNISCEKIIEGIAKIESLHHTIKQEISSEIKNNTLLARKNYEIICNNLIRNDE